MNARQLRVRSLEAELEKIIPDASRRLGCNSRQLRSERLMEEDGERVYRVRGCNLGTTYVCRSDIVEEEAIAHCHHTTSGAEI
jgi:hypothetical protein